MFQDVKCVASCSICAQVKVPQHFSGGKLMPSQCIVPQYYKAIPSIIRKLHYLNSHNRLLLQFTLTNSTRGLLSVHNQQSYYFTMNFVTKESQKIYLVNVGLNLLYAFIEHL